MGGSGRDIGLQSCCSLRSIAPLKVVAECLSIWIFICPFVCPAITVDLDRSTNFVSMSAFFYLSSHFLSLFLDHFFVLTSCTLVSSTFLFLSPMRTQLNPEIPSRGRILYIGREPLSRSESWSAEPPPTIRFSPTMRWLKGRISQVQRWYWRSLWSWSSSIGVFLSFLCCVNLIA